MSFAPTTPELSADDAQHLSLLATFHYVGAAVIGLFSLFPIIHVAMGVAILNGMLEDIGQQQGPGFPREFGWFFIVVGGMVITAGLSLAAFTAVVGGRIAARRSHLMCLINAGILCMFMPIGTALGIFTFIVLMRPQVKAEFDRSY